MLRSVQFHPRSTPEFNDHPCKVNLLKGTSQRVSLAFYRPKASNILVQNCKKRAVLFSINHRQLREKLQDRTRYNLIKECQK